ncbi:hypothetical protein B0O80DRAFT_449642 [Mortierella sp. GBAus27b]|nr:hypothetical protein B0O80DRAFT_449642 [Mortierella sp. GBAus27b]
MEATVRDPSTREDGGARTTRSGPTNRGLQATPRGSQVLTRPAASCGDGGETVSGPGHVKEAKAAGG